MTLQLLLTLSLGISQVPVDAAVPAALPAADVPATVQMTETHFLARSLADEPQWLVFANEERSLIRVRDLAPGERAVLPIVAGAAEGMSVEFVKRNVDGELLTSGLFDCESLTGESLFFVAGDDQIDAWMPRHGGKSLTRAEAGESCLPAALLAPRRVASAPKTAPRAAAQPLSHVPVPLPSENRKRDKSRPIQKKKLPPI